MREIERHRFLILEGKIHDLKCAILRGDMSVQKATLAIEELMKKPEDPEWVTRKRYQSWVIEPITPELLYQPEDADFSKAYWKSFDISKITTDDPRELGSKIYKKLMDSELLSFCPSLEAIEFYGDPKNQMLRKRFWDRTNCWVYAWRDAVLSNRSKSNILVRGLKVDNKTGEVIKKWRSLHLIHETKFKVIYRA